MMILFLFYLFSRTFSVFTGPFIRPIGTETFLFSFFFFHMMSLCYHFGAYR